MPSPAPPPAPGPAAGLFLGGSGFDDGPPAGADWAEGEDWAAGVDWAALEAQWAEEDAADERLATAPPGPEIIKAGFWDRTGGDGAGFAAGGAADTLPPGPVLAGLADRAWHGGLARLDDDELIGVLRAARRLASRAAALEYAAAADLMRRRLAQEAAGQARVAEHAADEIAAALTLTNRSADRLLSLAITLDGLPATRAALATGNIDPPKAGVIADETAALGPAHRAAVEQHLLGRAGGQTTGELRAAARRAVIAADPAAARRRKEHAQKDARVERWHEDAGTTALAGRDLPPTTALAADHHLSDLARQLKTAGAPGTLDHLRAQVFLTLLTSQPLTSLLPPNTRTSTSGTTQADTDDTHTGAGTSHPAGAGQPAPGQPAPGGINLTLPLATWLGTSDAPGNVAGFGPLDAADSRTLAANLAARVSTTWCITLTGTDGRPLAHGCATPQTQFPRARGKPGASRAGPSPGGNGPHAGPTAPASNTQTTRAGPSPGGPAWTFTITPLAGRPCTHTRGTQGYQPSPTLRHLLEIRHTTCTYPGCRRPARRCDQDHTVPYANGGRTCECGLAPLCRRHHKAKQTHGWRLEQPHPGLLAWTTPSGRTYTTHPTQYPE